MRSGCKNSTSRSLVLNRGCAKLHSSIYAYHSFVRMQRDHHHRAAMRVEVIGENIGDPVGLGVGGRIPDKAITSSALEPEGNSNPVNVRFNNTER